MSRLSSTWVCQETSGSLTKENSLRVERSDVSLLLRLSVYLVKLTTVYVRWFTMTVINLVQ